MLMLVWGLPKMRDDHLNLTEPDGLRLLRSSARRPQSPKSHHASGRYRGVPKSSVIARLKWA
jgi:hypothetical protein